MAQGVLYIVATPIGNLEDLSMRAARVLAEVDLIAAEDTRHTRKLLAHLGIQKPLVAYHEHNEDRLTAKLVERLQGGESIALVSDAGTPLISDPGYLLVRQVREHGLEAVAVPGPSALTAALSVAGIAVHRFAFEGFLPAERGARLTRLQETRSEARTLIYYEAPHRIGRTLQDLCEVFGGERQAALARELTKLHEQVRSGRLEDLCAQVESGAIPQRGEFVVLVQGSDGALFAGAEQSLLELLLPELPPRRAVDIVAKATGGNRRDLYQLALRLQGKA